MAWLRIGMGVGVSAGAWVAGYLIENADARTGLYAAAGSAVLMFGIALASASVLRRGTDRPEVMGDDDAPPPVGKGEQFVEQPPISPNI